MGDRNGGIEMDDRYCPAGKINCKHYNKQNECATRGTSYKSILLDYFEQCPWPSKQKPIKDWKEIFWSEYDDRINGDGDEPPRIANSGFIMNLLIKARKEAGLDD